MGMEKTSSRAEKPRDPFAEDLPAKAFYHPSRQKKLGRSDRKIALSPDRQRFGSKNRSPAEEMFLKGTNAFSTQFRTVKDGTRGSLEQSSEFDETWPSSERPSNSSIPDFEDDQNPLTMKHSMIFDRFSDLKQTLLFSEKDSTVPTSQKPKTGKRAKPDGSVLQKYIDRFRCGAPMSREERAKHNTSNSRDFWWLASSPPTPSDSSTPKDEASGRTKSFTHKNEMADKVARNSSEDKSVRLTASSLKSLSQSRPPDDEEILRLQQKADQLLEESESSLHSSGPVVSTEGLGSSNSTSFGTSFDEQPYRPAFARNVGKVEKPYVRDGPLSGGWRLRPENDILYQWRLQRKMETAKQSVLNSDRPFPVVRPGQDLMNTKLEQFRQKLAGRLHDDGAVMKLPVSVSFTPASSAVRTKEVQLKVDAEVQTKPVEHVELGKGTFDELSSKSEDVFPNVASPTLSRRKTARSSVNPHLHLMCDLLPCPHAEKYAEKFKDQHNLSDVSALSESDSDSASKEKHKTQYKQYLQAEKPHSEERKLKPRERHGHKVHAEHTYRKHRSVVSSGMQDRKKSTASDSEIGVLSGSEDQKGQTVQYQDHIFEEKHFEEQKLRQHRKKENILQQCLEDVVSETSDSLVKKVFEKCSETSHLQEKSSDGEDKTEHIQSQHQTTTRIGLPRPRYSSSPSRQTASLKSAVGQAIKDHLFNTSASSVVSSADSWASITDQGIQPQGPACVDPSTLKKTDEVSDRQQGEKNDVHINEDDQYESDGDFPDDHFLQMLRQQRAQHEERLQQIDEILTQHGQWQNKFI